MRMSLTTMVLLLVAFGHIGATQTPPTKELQRLDPQIPAADRAKYRDIRDAKDWLNPEVLVGADGIEVVSRAALPEVERR